MARHPELAERFHGGKGAHSETDDSSDSEQHFDRVVDVLADRFAGVHDRATVAQVVEATRRELEADAKVTGYLPVLVTRHAIDRLAGRTAV